MTEMDIEDTEAVPDPGLLTVMGVAASEGSAEHRPISAPSCACYDDWSEEHVRNAADTARLRAVGAWRADELAKWADFPLDTATTESIHRDEERKETVRDLVAEIRSLCGVPAPGETGGES